MNFHLSLKGVNSLPILCGYEAWMNSNHELKSRNVKIKVYNLTYVFSFYFMMQSDDKVLREFPNHVVGNPKERAYQISSPLKK